MAYANTDFPLVIEAAVVPEGAATFSSVVTFIAEGHNPAAIPSFPSTDFPLDIVASPWTRLATVVANTYDDATVTEGVTYQYRVVNTTTGETLTSEEVTAIGAQSGAAEFSAVVGFTAAGFKSASGAASFEVEAVYAAAGFKAASGAANFEVVAMFDAVVLAPLRNPRLRPSGTLSVTRPNATIRRRP